MNTKAIYTAIYGNFDEVYDPVKDIDCDYYLFTDNEKLDAKGWTRIVVDIKEDTPLLQAKMPKIFPYEFLKNYKQSIWIDGNIQITQAGFGNYMFNKLQKDIALANHPFRKNLIEEIKEIVRLAKAPAELVQKQVDTYLADGFKKESLYHCGVIARNHTDVTKKLGEKWWAEIKKWSKRDQLSFPYILWKYGIEVNSFDWSAISDVFFKTHYHIKK